tara:strand:- start:750 stop:1268 length:519 start_codon:yes stop_codon:yes gene_type:complete
MRKLINFFLILTITLPLISCGGIKKVDQRSRPSDPEERRRQAVSEGRGTGINELFNRNRSNNFEFSSSNPMWRASLETLDFLPLLTVDYSGGVIITDWYSESGGRDSIKLTIRFLSNEIRSDSLKIIVHKRTCQTISNCKTIVSKSNLIKDELRSTILRKASLLLKSDKKKK